MSGRSHQPHISRYHRSPRLYLIAPGLVAVTLLLAACLRTGANSAWRAESDPTPTRSQNNALTARNDILADLMPGAKNLRFSDDNQHVAYAVPQSGRWSVYLDAKQIGTYDEPLLLELSPTGGRLACIVKDNGKPLVIVDGKVIPIDGISEAHTVMFSPDGKRIAFEVKQGDKWRMVIDGQAGPRYDRTVYCTYSPDSKRLAYVVEEGGREVVVTDGIPGAAYHEIVEDTPIFSPDSKHIGYAALTVGGGTKQVHTVVVIDGKEGPPFNYVVKRTLGFSADSRKVFYATTGLHAGDSVVIDGKGTTVPNPVVEESLRLSPDGAHSAYVSVQNGKSLAVFDLRPQPVADTILNPVFSPNSQRAAYTAQVNGKWHVVVDGQPGPDFDDIGEGAPFFSLDSRHVAYLAKLGESWQVVVDGKPGPAFDTIAHSSPSFTPDGRHIAYIGGRGKKWCVILDGEPGPEYDGFIGCKLIFDNATMFHTAAVLNHKLVIARLTIEAKL